MQKNIEIDFSPKCDYKKWVFNGITNTKENDLEYFSKIQVIESVEEVLSKIPNRILEATMLTNWKIIITNNRKLEEECGAPKRIYGYTNFKKKEIVIYATKEGIEISLPHEIAHFFDVLTDISITKEWQKVYSEEKDIYLTMSTIFTTPKYKSECFADAFMYYIIYKENLKRNTPKSYAVIDNIFTYIDYILDEECIRKYNEKQQKQDEDMFNKITEISCFSEYNWN